MTRNTIAALCVVLLTAVAGCGGDGEPRVEMGGGQRFEPEELEVSAGDEIVFTNTSGEGHSVTAYSDGLPEGADYFSSGGFDSEAAARADLAGTLIHEGETFSVTLSEPGTYRYFCIPHEDSGMTGRIVVE